MEINEETRKKMTNSRVSERIYVSLKVCVFLNVKPNMVHETEMRKRSCSELIGGIRCDDTCGMFRLVFF